jgi:hypothetical protein
MACLERRCACRVKCRCAAASRRPPEPYAIVAESSSLDSGNRARPVDRSARLSWVSIVSRKFCRRWKRSATCRAWGAPSRAPCAGRHAKTLHQSFSRPAARSASEKMNKFSDSLGSTSVRIDNFRQLIRKCLTRALPVQTSPTAHLHLHQHGDALHREILNMTEVSAVPTCRRRAASGTGAHFHSCGRDHPTITVPLDPKNPHTRPGSPICAVSHPSAYRRTRTSNQAARKVRQTQKLVDRLGRPEHLAVHLNPEI